MTEFADKMQSNLKKTSGDFALFSLKLISGGTIGLTFALVMQEVLAQSGDENLLAFFFVIIVTTGVFLRVAKEWGFVPVLIFDLICVLIGMVLRLYIMVAPGA